MADIKNCVICCGIENRQTKRASNLSRQIFENKKTEDNVETKTRPDWKAKIAETLGEILLGNNDHFLVNYFMSSDYCSSCLKVIRNLDYLSEQIKLFQSALEVSVNEIRDRIQHSCENESGKPNDDVQSSLSYRIDYYANNTKMMKDYSRREIVEIVMTGGRSRNKLEMKTKSKDDCIQEEQTMDFIKPEPVSPTNSDDNDDIDNDNGSDNADDNCLGMNSFNNDDLDDYDYENVIAKCSVALSEPASSIRASPSSKPQEKLSICQFCNETFKFRWQKKRHIDKWHIKPPDFVCSTCGAKYRRKWDLERHRQRKHKLK